MTSSNKHTSLLQVGTLRVAPCLNTNIRLVWKWLTVAKSLAYYDAEFIEQCTLKNVNNCLNTNSYSYLETSGGHSSDLYLNVVHFFNTSVN